MNDINVPSAERKMRKWFNLPRFPSPLFKSYLQYLLFCVIYSAVFAAGYRVVVGALPPTGYSSFWILSASILLAAWPWALLASSFITLLFSGPFRMRWVGAGCKLFSRVLSWALLVALVGLWWSSMAPEHAERVPGLLNKAWARGSEAVFGGNETSSAAMPVTSSPEKKPATTKAGTTPPTKPRLAFEW